MTMSAAINPLTYDVVIDKTGKLLRVTGAQEVGQRIGIWLRHYYGEYFLHTDHGLPYHEAMLGSRDFKMVESMIRNEVLQVSGVVSIAAITIERPKWENGNSLTVSMKVEVEGEAGSNIVDIVERVSI